MSNDKGLDSLPTVITAPGDFITRDGRRVTIHEIGTGTFAAKGAVWKLRGGVSSPTGFDIWHVSGRHLPLNEDPRDIVGPWKVPSKVGDRRLTYSEGHRVRLRPETAGSWIDKRVARAALTGLIGTVQGVIGTANPPMQRSYFVLFDHAPRARKELREQFRADDLEIAE